MQRSIPLCLKDVANHTSNDPELKKVISAINDEWPTSTKQLLPFYHIRDELSQKSQDDKIIITKGNRVVIPTHLR